MVKRKKRKWMKKKLTKKYGPYTVTITNPKKPLLGTYTKGDLITYYDAIASKMVPYLKNHPLMMHRFPDGLDGESFYQKDASSYFPHWIKKVRIEKKGGFYTSVVCQNRATLVYLANQACVTPHIWLSRVDKLTIPDRIIFDLDPSDDDFKKVAFIALEIKKLLDALGLVSFIMTTGSQGLHIYIPLRRSADFEQTKAFTQACAQKIVDDHPDKATLEFRKDKRGTNVFIDILRNQQGATSVAPYSVRARPNAPIATPLFWHEIEDPTLHPQKYTIANIFKRLSTIEDPWKSFFKRAQSIKQAHKKMGRL